MRLPPSNFVKTIYVPSPQKLLCKVEVQKPGHKMPRSGVVSGNDDGARETDGELRGDNRVGWWE
jgi:hypothetical protein